MELPIEKIIIAGQQYRTANHQEKRTILKDMRKQIGPWDSITRNMLVRSFERAAGEEFAW